MEKSSSSSQKLLHTIHIAAPYWFKSLPLFIINVVLLFFIYGKMIQCLLGDLYSFIHDIIVHSFPSSGSHSHSHKIKVHTTNVINNNENHSHLIHTHTHIDSYIFYMTHPFAMLLIPLNIITAWRSIVIFVVF